MVSDFFDPALLTEALPDIPEFSRWKKELAEGESVDDSDFDRIYPHEYQVHSRIHWTPIKVIQRACEFLVPRPGARVLDVGSGVGKFCLVGSLISQGDFFGIEQRLNFAQVARRVGAHYRIPRATFYHGNARDMDWTPYDGIYLYNPFCEARYPQRQIDLDIPAGNAVFREYVRMTRAQLRRCPIGTRVVTYHGFGGRVPECYDHDFSEPCGSGQLDGYVRTRQ